MGERIQSARLRAMAAQRYQDGDLYEADALMLRVVESGDATLADLLTSSRLAFELGDYTRADALLAQLLEQTPHEPAVVNTAVRLRVAQGRLDDMEALLADALAVRPHDPELLALAVTHVRSPDHSIVGNAVAVVDALPDSAPLKPSLLYPIARLHDRDGAYDKAWATMLRANAITRQQRGVSVAQDPRGLRRELVALMKNALSKAADVRAPAADAPRWLFLTGAPRTGGTLLQTVLAAQRGIHSVGERGALMGPLYAAVNAKDAISPGRIAELRQADMSGLARMGHTDGVLVDKTPHHFYLLPLLQAVYPGARFINQLRDPRDVAVSMLFREFSPAFPEATELPLIVEMLTARTEGLALFRANDIAVTLLHYEEFVAAPAAVGRSLAADLAIEWDERAMEDRNRDAVVTTHSATQVRESIHADEVQRWRRYERFLGDCREALEELAERQEAL